MVDKSLLITLGDDLASVSWKQIICAIPGKSVLHALRILGLEESDSTKLNTNRNRRMESDYQSMISGNFTTTALTQDEERNLKAVKADNAEVPVSLWNDRIVRSTATEEQNTALETIRNKVMLRWYRRRVFKSYINYMIKTHGKGWSMKLSASRCAHEVDTEIHKDGRVGMDALRRILNASWWSWKAGSTLLFWRWARENRREARDGTILPWKLPPFPRYVLPQRYPNNQLEKESMIEKVRDPVSKRIH